MTTCRTVLFVHYGENWIRGSERVLLDLLAGLDKHRIRPVLWCNAEAMASEAKALGVTTHVSPMAYFLDYSSPRFSPRCFARLLSDARQLIRQEKVELVQANSAAPCQWLAPAARSLRLPLVVHLHASYLTRSRYVCLLHLAHRIVGASQHALTGLREDGLPPSRTQVILNGVDASRLGIPGQGLRERLEIPQDAFVILAVGSLISRKRHHLLIDAVSRMPETSHLVILGEGELREPLEQRVRELGLSKRVHLPGSWPALASVYADADCFALASYKETFGLVFAEAGLCGLPAVGVRGGGVTEVIEDGVTGLLVDEGAEERLSESLAAHLSTLRQNEAQRSALGVAARARIAREFDGKRMVEGFHALYDQLMAAPSAQRGWSSIHLTPYLALRSRLKSSPRP